MSGNAPVKIILPCANEGEWVRWTVDSILEHTRHPGFEIVISANGDSQTDFSFLEEPAYRQRVTLRTAPQFLGVGNGRNVAVAPGDARYYIFLDAHCLIEQDDWLERALAGLEVYPRASMIQPEVQCFTYEGEARPGVVFQPTRIRRSFCEYSTRWAWPYDEPWRVVETIWHRESSIPFEAMSGAGMAIFVRAETFHRLGGFDSEVIGWFHETMDYCVRAWMLGYPMMVDPRIRILHRMKTEIPAYPRSYLHVIQGNLRTAYKYLSPRRMDTAVHLFRQHGFHRDVDEALRLLHRGRWLAERARHLRERFHDDDWLFERFGVYEERFVG